MNHALHEARQALINAAKIGVDDSKEAISAQDYRLALIATLAGRDTEVFSEALKDWVKNAEVSLSGPPGLPQPEPIVPIKEIERGMRLVAPLAMASARPSEVTAALDDLRRKWPNIKISAGSVDMTTLWPGANRADLAHELRSLGEQAYLRRP